MALRFHEKLMKIDLYLNVSKFIQPLLVNYLTLLIHLENIKLILLQINLEVHYNFVRIVY